MESFFSLIFIMSGLGFLLGCFLCTDHRKVDRRFKTGYKNNEPKDEHSPVIGAKILMVCLPLLLLCMVFSPDKSKKDVDTNINNEEKWVYYKINENQTVSEIFHGSDKLIIRCLDKKKISMILETNRAFDKTKMKQLIILGNHRSVSSIHSMESLKDRYIYELDKDKVLKNLMKEKEITIRIHDKTSEENFKFSLKDSRKTISSVLSDCHGNW